MPSEPPQIKMAMHHIATWQDLFSNCFANQTVKYKTGMLASLPKWALNMNMRAHGIQVPAKVLITLAESATASLKEYMW